MSSCNKCLLSSRNSIHHNPRQFNYHEYEPEIETPPYIEESKPFSEEDMRKLIQYAKEQGWIP